MGHACADHHPSTCPSCRIVSLHWSASHGRNITIIPTAAPAAVRRLIEWAQDNLDELEAVEVWIALEELASRTGGD
jgi:hypothetical protein